MPPNDAVSDHGCPGCAALRDELGVALELIAQQAAALDQQSALLAQQTAALDQQIALNSELRSRVAVLEERLEQVEQQAHRQAAPFRRPEAKRKDKKSKPGRKGGHPPSYRQPPTTVDESAEVPLDHCPYCSGAVEDVRPVRQVIEDIPAVVVRRLHLTTYRGHCPHCGTVRSTHPEQVSTATGAAGTHVGRRALALAADLNKHLGIPMRKTCRILKAHFGLHLTPGGLSQALDRVADKLHPQYEQIGLRLRHSVAVHADETSWWLQSKSAWLWVFTNPEATLYTIGDRSQEVIRSILGDDYGGVLISDCLASYDPHPGRKSKCVAHHLKAISESLERVADSPYLKHARDLFRAAIIWHGLRDELPPATYWERVFHLQQGLEELLAAAPGHPEELRIMNRLRKQRPHLLTFLHVPGVDPTNNLAERQLRPAVIARKLSAGNKTTRGKCTFEILASLAATSQQQGRSFSDLVANRLSLGLPPPAPLFGPA